MSDCIEWTGTFNTSGYPVDGRQSQRTKYGTQYAHRQAWIDRFGAIPEGLHIDHLCENPACVNPDHMQLLTPEAHGKKSTFHLIEGGTCRSGDHIITKADIDNGTCLECRRHTNREYEQKRAYRVRELHPTLRARGLCRKGLHDLTVVGRWADGRCAECGRIKNDRNKRRPT